MVQSSPSSIVSEQQLTKLLGTNLAKSDLANCLQQIQVLEPTAGKLFWQSSDANQGIYMIAKGKVRLLDQQNNLLATIGQGESFGELDFFPEKNFQPYMARASVSLKLGFLPQEYLHSLLGKYADVGDRFYRQALLWELFCLCRQTMPLVMLVSKQ